MTPVLVRHAAGTARASHWYFARTLASGLQTPYDRVFSAGNDPNGPGSTPDFVMLLQSFRRWLQRQARPNTAASSRQSYAKGASAQSQAACTRTTSFLQTQNFHELPQVLVVTPEARKEQHAHQSMMRPTNGEMSAAPASAHAAACGTRKRLSHGRCTRLPHRRHATRFDEADPAQLPLSGPTLKVRTEALLCCLPWYSTAAGARAHTAARHGPPLQGRQTRRHINISPPSHACRAGGTASLIETRACLGKGEEQRHVAVDALLLQRLARADALPGRRDLPGAPSASAAACRAPSASAVPRGHGLRSAAVHMAACGRCAALARRRRLMLQLSCAGG